VSQYALQIGFYLLWLPLMVLTLNAVFHAGVRRYPLCFIYLVVTFLIAVIQLRGIVAYHDDHRVLGWVNTAHQTGESVARTFLLAVVVNLIFRATARVKARRLIRGTLIGAVLTFAAVSFAVHFHRHQSLMDWMMPWTRDQNFCAAGLDFALWTLLLGAREKDTRLLLLTGGMGIMFAGDAIADAIRYLGAQQRSNLIFTTGNIVAALADSMFLYVWWRTFRKDRAGAVLARANGGGA
jgi:hypothetical protein